MKIYNALSKSFTDEVKAQMGVGKSIDAAFELVKPNNANGHEYVDLDLPSGTIWAACNVGADKPEDSGLLFQFGRVDGYAYNDSNNHFRTEAQNTQDNTGNSYIPLTTSGRTYNEGEILDLADDAAHVNMGGAWKMPTKEDFEELLKYTNHEVTSINEVQGMMFTSKINMQQLFIPFAGHWYFDGHFYNAGSKTYVWSSLVSTSNSNNREAYSLYCNSSDNTVSGYNSFRINGQSVRGVFKTSPKPTSTPKPIDVNKLTKGDGQKDGYYYVDLGLSVKWATCNVGADSASDEGKLFQFGRVDGYRYNDSSNQFRTNAQNKQDTGNEYIPKTASGKTYDKGATLQPADDAAHVNMGGKWRMPTGSYNSSTAQYEGEWGELLNNTTYDVVTVNGIQGMLFTSTKPGYEGKQLFIPFMQGSWLNGNWENWGRSDAYVWSSQVHPYNVDGAYRLYCSSSGNAYILSNRRSFAFSVRGVFQV